jgi:hypothetical protein
MFIVPIYNIRNEKQSINEERIQAFHQTLEMQHIHTSFIGLFQVSNYHIQLKHSLKNIHNANMQTFNHLIQKKN